MIDVSTEQAAELRKDLDNMTNKISIERGGYGKS